MQEDLAKRDLEAKDRDFRLQQTIADRDMAMRADTSKLLEKITETKSDSFQGDNDKKWSSLAKTFLTQMPTATDEVHVYLRSCEKLFCLNSVPVDSYVKLLLPYMSQRVRSITLALSEHYYKDYERWRKQVMSDISLTASRYRSLFQDAKKSSSETYVEFSHRLTTYLDTYLELAEVKDFESLRQLLLTDRIKESLPTDIRSVVHKEITAKKISAQSFAATLDSLESEKIIGGLKPRSQMFAATVGKIT